jgi:hypothetical protein
MHNGEACLMCLANFMLATCLTYSSILNMEAVCSSVTSMNVYWATVRYIPFIVSYVRATDVSSVNSIKTSSR